MTPLRWRRLICFGFVYTVKEETKHISLLCCETSKLRPGVTTEDWDLPSIYGM